MNYKKVKLLDESGNEELYPETDWSIVKNSPINTGNDGITINKKGRNILLRSKNCSIEGKLNVRTDRFVFDVPINDVFYSNNGVNGETVNFIDLPRSEEATQNLPYGDLFGTVHYLSDSPETVIPAFEVMKIMPNGEKEFTYYSFGDASDKFSEVDLNGAKYTPINNISTGFGIGG